MNNMANRKTDKENLRNDRFCHAPLFAAYSTAAANTPNRTTGRVRHSSITG